MVKTLPFRRVATLVAALAVLTLVLMPHAAHAGRGQVSLQLLTYTDVTPDMSWASNAIDYVAVTNDWMRDYPINDDLTYSFKPADIETRAMFASALVKAYAPGDLTNPLLELNDMDPETDAFHYANVAVTRGWMLPKRIGEGLVFRPDDAVTAREVHRALVWVLGLKSAAKSIQNMTMADGTAINVPPLTGSTIIGMRLGLRYNNSDEAQDVGPRTPLNRAQVAYSLWKSFNLQSWVVPSLLSQYSSVTLPALGPSAQAILGWGLKYVGYPYIWAGEWGLDTPEPSALGSQPIPGFDCSGLTWWLTKANSGAWAVAPPRPYAGWTLAERSSSSMATYAKSTYDQALPGDLMFYDGNRDGIIDHVDVNLGNGWALDSSSSVAGVTIMWIGSGWYRDHFVKARRVIPAGA